MLAHIIDWSGRNRFLVLLATLFITVWGVFAVLRTPMVTNRVASRTRKRFLPDHSMIFASMAPNLP